MTATLRPAVFLDKDGTLVNDVPYNVDPDLLSFTPHAIEGLQLLVHHGFQLVVVTNQPGVAMGRFELAALDHLFDGLAVRLAGHGVRVAGFRFCPHAPAADGRPVCGCRKPRPGMLLDAARSLHADLPASWMVGDILDDIEAGRRAGCRTVLLDVGNETVWQRGPEREPHHRAPHLLAAAQHIVAQTNFIGPAVAGAVT